MAVVQALNYSVPGGNALRAGTFDASVFGTSTLDALSPSGIFGSNLATVSGSVLLDDALPTGNLGGFVAPTWRTAAVGAWGTISGTSGPIAGLNTNAFGALAIRPSDGTVVQLAQGGHNDGSSNACASLRLLDNAPSWTVRKASTWVGPDNNGVNRNVTYLPDGTPASRHGYYHCHYIASRDSVLLAGGRFTYGDPGPNSRGMDLFSLVTNNWEPVGTFTDLPDLTSDPFGVVVDGNGNVWTPTGRRFNVSTNTWSTPGTVPTFSNARRYPAAYSPALNVAFFLQYHDGEGFGTGGLQAWKLDPTTGNGTVITFNSSAAFTQFQADAPAYAAMEYCPLDQKFYFLHPGRMGTFYVITPNAGTTWDMDTFTPTGTAPTVSGVLCKRLLWSSAVNCFIVQANHSANLAYVRMA